MTPQRALLWTLCCVLVAPPAFAASPEGARPPSRSQIETYLDALSGALEPAQRPLLLGHLLHEAARDGTAYLIEPILDRGISPDYDAGGVEESTPLMKASRQGHLAVVRLLLERGADPRRIDKEGRSPLSYAYDGDRPEVGEALLRHGAAPDSHTAQGSKLLAAAVAAGRQGWIDLLAAHGAHLEPAEGLALVERSVAANTAPGPLRELAARLRALSVPLDPAATGRLLVETRLASDSELPGAARSALAAAFAAQSSPDRVAQRRTVEDMRWVGLAMMNWYADGGVPPFPAPGEEAPLGLISAARLRQLLVPQYIQEVPDLDGWGHPYEYRIDKQDKASDILGIRSPGRDGAFSENPGYTGPFHPAAADSDLVWGNGVWVRWPGLPD